MKIPVYQDTGLLIPSARKNSACEWPVFAGRRSTRCDRNLRFFEFLTDLEASASFHFRVQWSGRESKRRLDDCTRFTSTDHI
jgi:hypothetical protein